MTSLRLLLTGVILELTVGDGDFQGEYSFASRCQMQLK